MRQLEPRQFNSVVTLLVGLVAGLLLGLFIGWVVWPVEWQGATLNELFPTERAEYLGAVADAFALDRSPEAAERARQRVAALGADLSGALEAAIAHFSNTADPSRDLRINNLTFLASSLGIATPGLVGVTQNAPADSGAPANPATALVAPVETTGDSTASWLTWLLYVLAGLLLILLGLYLILRLRQGRQSAAPTGEYIDREIGSLQNVAADPWAQRTQSYVAADDDPSYQMAATNDDEWQQSANPQALPEDYSFDDDPEEPSHVRPGVRNWVGANRGSHVAQLRLDHNDDGEEDDLLEEEEEEAEPPTPYRSASGVAAASAATMRQPSEPTAAPQATVIQHRPELRPAVAPRAEAAFTPVPISTERPISSGRPLAKHKLLEIYTAQYQVGLHDYDESHPIMDPAAGKYVGECGMGTSTKNGLLQNHPDQVVALEVWLFDKTDEKNVGTQTRVLLSEYAIDHNLEQAFTKERQDDPRPFTAQPNTRFQLESQNLLLDCTITEATYAPSGPTKGIFQTVTVEMSVYKKG